MDYDELRERLYKNQSVSIFKEDATIDDIHEIIDGHLAHTQHMNRIFECPISVAFDLVHLAMEVAETENGLIGRKQIADYMEDHARIAKFAVNRSQIKVVPEDK